MLHLSLQWEDALFWYVDDSILNTRRLKLKGEIERDPISLPGNPRSNIIHPDFFPTEQFGDCQIPQLTDPLPTKSCEVRTVGPRSFFVLFCFFLFEARTWLPEWPGYIHSCRWYGYSLGVASSHQYCTNTLFLPRSFNHRVYCNSSNSFLYLKSNGINQSLVIGRNGNKFDICMCSDNGEIYQSDVYWYGQS